ncbi:alpha/beta hydrolase family protein [Intrasporangium calvum]|uniref:alpha/beta hydrolase family protein n=1 Tax=Intrasporangium calvum TaxID=53358 RepID=UPI0019012028|nr:prolyl oligopeptidase family serine peptidase [Intrasporangium calvum]
MAVAEYRRAGMPGGGWPGTFDDIRVRDFLGSPDSAPAAWRAADPVRGLPPRVPVRLVHGELDHEVPVSVTDAYVREARRLGADVTLHVVPGAGHYSLSDPQSPAWPHILVTLDGLV